MVDTLNISHLNVNGWTLANSKLMEGIVDALNSHIISVNETHLTENEHLYVENYKFYGHNRHAQHSRAVKASGGVGLFVRRDLLNHFTVSVFDQTFEGVLALQFLINYRAIHLLCCRYISHQKIRLGVEMQKVFLHIF